MLRSLIAGSIGSVLLAQDFATLQPSFLPFDTPSLGAAAAAVADFDGDGDLDVVAHVLSTHLQLFRNDGEGRYQREQLGYMPPAQIAGPILAAADVDNDGDADVLFAHNGGSACSAQDVLLTNTGTGAFAASSLDSNNDATISFVLVDIEPDGDPDVVCCNRGVFLCQPQPSRLLRNDLSGTFTNVSQLFVPGPPMQAASAAALDVNGDGRVDLVFEGSPVQVYLQAITGSFVLTPNVIAFPLVGLQGADIDHDGDRDLVGKDAGIVKILRNDGSGAWSPWTIAQAAPDRIVLGDIDGDLDLDVLVAFGFFGQGVSLWRQDPGTQFTDVTATHLGTAQAFFTFAAQFFDSDGDGDSDLLHGFVGLLHNDGAGHLLRLESWQPTNAHRAFATDVDGDGFADLLGGIAFAWWRNDGGGNFPLAAMLPGTGDGRTLVLLDIEGDGDQDLLGGSTQLLRNDGGGVFTNITATALPPMLNPTLPATRPVSIALAGDLDGDGDQDLFLGHDGQWLDTVLRNDGTGLFADVSAASLTDPYLTNDADLLDFDRDGDLDLVIASTNGIARLFANNGAGAFTDVTSQRLPSTAAGSQVIAFDSDGDGDPDLVLTALGWGATRLLRNDSGVFTDVSASLPWLYGQYDPLVGDFDDDGDLDLRATAWLLNDGAGHFSLAPRQPQASFNQAYVKRLFDIDGDRDVDFVDGRRNLFRQMVNAVPPRIGYHGELHVYAHSTSDSWSPLALLLAAPGPATPAIALPPFGTLHLPPATTTLQAVLTVPDQGVVVFRYACPTAPALLGSTLWTQPLFLHGPDVASWHLGTPVPLRIQV